MRGCHVSQPLKIMIVQVLLTSLNSSKAIFTDNTDGISYSKCCRMSLQSISTTIRFISVYWFIHMTWIQRQLLTATFTATSYQSASSTIQSMKHSYKQQHQHLWRCGKAGHTSLANLLNLCNCTGHGSESARFFCKNINSHCFDRRTFLL